MIGETLSVALMRAGYSVQWVTDGEVAELAALYENFDVAILDINLPKKSGLEVLKLLRQRKKDLPILLLTARFAPAHRVAGLDLGADDYVIKPFDLDELLARLRSITRRHQGRVENVIRTGDITFDTVRMKATLKEEEIALQPKELRLLALLMQNRGKPVSKSVIEQYLYSDDENFESNTVEVLIYSLRKKFGPEAIKTQRGVGYIMP